MQASRLLLPSAPLPVIALQSKRKLLVLPNTEEEFVKPSNKTVSFMSEVSEGAVTAFNMMSRHFPSAWGFMWGLEDNHLSKMIVNLPEDERENVYKALAAREGDEIRERTAMQDSPDIRNGLLTVGGESGKRVISEAYSCNGVPPFVTFRCDLLLADVKNKVPLAWIVKKAPVAFNIHPAPPEKRGAGVYVPSLLAGEKEYGLVVHFINDKVDDGPIIAVKRFPIPDGSTTSSLRRLTTQHCILIFEDLLYRMKFTSPLSDMATSCHYAWSGNQFTRRMVRRLLKETRSTYGEKGHPVLL